MEFRWVAVIALWTLLIGPVFDPPGRPSWKPPNRTQANSKPVTMPHPPALP
jgi:hypothetical protein